LRIQNQLTKKPTSLAGRNPDTPLGHHFPHDLITRFFDNVRNENSCSGGPRSCSNPSARAKLTDIMGITNEKPISSPHLSTTLQPSLVKTDPSSGQSIWFSKVDLSKLYRTHNIPLPPIGYSMKVPFGIYSPKPSLPKVEHAAN
jgi:hypothetical protein